VAERIALPVTVVDVIGDWLGVPVRMFPFDIPHQGHTWDEREHLAAAVWRDLSTSGLTSGGHLLPELEEAVRSIGRARVSAAMVLTAGREGQQAVRAASDGRRAAIAIQAGETVSYEPLHPAEVISALAGLVPAGDPLPGRSVTFPSDNSPRHAASRVAEDENENMFVATVLEDARPAVNSYAAQQDIAERMMRHPCQQGGMAIMFGRDTHGRERPGPSLVWRDTSAGRFMAYTTTGPDGAVWESFAPADTTRLAHRISELWDLAAATDERTGRSRP
jgi:hypothetical protein